MTSDSSRTDPVLGSIHAATFSESTSATIAHASAKLMGTTANVTTVGGSPDVPEKVIDYLRHLESLWSRFRADSELSHANSNPGISHTVSAETIRLVEEMKRGHRLTGGAFDPTLLGALIAQGYGTSLSNPRLVTTLPPSAKRRGDIAAIDISDSSLRLPLGTTLDSGGVGKGLAADLCAAHAMSLGALGALVDVGGDVSLQGASPRGNSWRLAIESPLDSSHRVSTVELSGGGIATSTVLKRRFVVGDTETHHIINPFTLESTQSDTTQATVIAHCAADAEMWTKVAFVHDSRHLFASAARHGFHAGCFLTSGEWITTKDWPEYGA